MKNKIKISIVVPVYNTETTLLESLESVKKQDFPIEEIIIIDNCSTDNSLKVAEDFKKKNKKLNIRIIKREKTYGICTSYNLGVKSVKTEFVVTLHSDSNLPTKKELRKLVEPLFDNDPSIVGTYPRVVHPKKVWLTYNFWQKCLFARLVGLDAPSNNGKFDCYRKKTFLKIGGFDEKKFNHFLGTEDADMDIRLRREGKLISTDARVIHLHSREKGYSLKSWIDRRKFLAVSYGWYLKMHAKSMKWNVLFFLVKPAIAFGTFSLFFNKAFLIVLILFPFWYMRKMFTEKTTLTDPRITILPFIILALNYYETFWMIQSLFFKKYKV